MTEPRPSADNVAIEAHGLGKRYHLYADRGRGRIVDRLASAIRGDPDWMPPEATVWALRDVSFEIPRGTVKGVIGRNGSGKSTLLRILARVTTPTTAHARNHGRVGALFHIGSGFSPEHSGRENIKLSGAILGMDPEVTDSLFDTIVEFSEIGDFIDMPVKHYSSGMYTRLAFSVSAHMAVEIMLVDEVLSVGDSSFKQKSQAYIRNMVQDGRSVLFVSHGIDAIKQLCDSAIVLEDGKLVFDGPTDEAVERYLESARSVRPVIRELEHA